MATTAGRQRGVAPAKSGGSQASNPLISEATLKQMYSALLQCRLIEERARQLRKREKHSRLGAVAVGAVFDLRRQDWLVPPPGNLLPEFVKGAPLNHILAHVPGDPGRDAEPSIYPGFAPLHIAPPASSPAAQLALASGLALIARTKNNGSIVMVFAGASPRAGGAWNDALAFAAAHCLPLIVITEAAASESAKPTTAAAVRAHLCGFPVIPVDAHDVVAIYRVAHESIHKARHGGGPTLIEATTLLDPLKRRAPQKELDSHAAIVKMEEYLTRKGLFSQRWKQSIVEKFKQSMDSAIQA